MQAYSYRLHWCSCVLLAEQLNVALNPNVIKVKKCGNQYLGTSRGPKLRSCGNRPATVRTTTIVPTPPATTEKTGPKKPATTPDSKAPSSFEVPIKRALSADTLPRNSSGVRS